MGDTASKPSKKTDGSSCQSASQCESNVCAKPCGIPTAQWNRIKNVDHWNHLKFCTVPGWSPLSFECVASGNYNGEILLNSDGTINYRGNPKGSKTTWDRNQCIKGVNCEGFNPPTSSGKICSGNYWLKGYKTTSKGECQKACQDRSNCDTFCWSDRSPEWDCLMYKKCDSQVTRFSSGNPTTSYTCFKRPAGEEAMGMTMVTSGAPGADDLAIDLMALIGLLFVCLLVFKNFARFVTNPFKKNIEVPTETTPMTAENACTSED